MRYYVGLGNAGCKMLRHLHQLLVKEGQQDRPTGIQAKFVFGDADANNNVISTIRASAAAPPGFETHLFPLDLFWSGGCGVYHIIGELITQRALNRGFGNLFGNTIADPLYVLFAAGDGTGGGSSAALEQFIHQPAQTPQRPVRLFVALPEIDRPAPASGAPASLEIHGPDDFQCAAAGRFLVGFLASAFLDVPVLKPAQRQLFVLSNSWLASVSNPASYPLAVKRLNLFLSTVLLLLDDTVAVYPILNEGQNQLVTFGLGLAKLPPAPPVNAADLALQLVRSALGPLNLQEGNERTCPVGLSALPLPARLYCDTPGGDEDHVGALSDLLAGAASQTPAAIALQAAFHCCHSVQILLLYRTPELATQLSNAGLASAVSALVQPLFGLHRPITVTDVTPGGTAAAWFAAHPSNLFPALAHDEPTDVALVLFLGNLLVEDVWRLIVYYLQSSFPWQASDVALVGDRLRDILLKHPATTNLLTIANQADPAALEARRQAIWEQVSDNFLAALTDSQAPAYLHRDVQELYPEQLWGNFEQLRLKVLVNLRMDETTFDQRRLTIDHVARALAFLSMQLWEV